MRTDEPEANQQADRDQDEQLRRETATKVQHRCQRDADEKARDLRRLTSQLKASVDVDAPAC